MSSGSESSWDARCLEEAHSFALKCAELSKDNPKSVPTLSVVISDLMTELWDQGFSQSEIKAAFEKALDELPDYAAGQEHR